MLLSHSGVASAANIVQWRSCTPTISINQTVRPLHRAIDLSLSMACSRKAVHRIGKQHEPLTRSLPTEPVTVMESACSVPSWPDSRGVLGSLYRQRLGILQVLVTFAWTIVQFANGRREQYFDAMMFKYLGREALQADHNSRTHDILATCDIDLLYAPWPYDPLFTLLPQICRERKRSRLSQADCNASLLTTGK